MDIGAGSFLLSYLAGLLSTLSPCVLALLPILVASALAEHHAGPWALAAGMTVSFVAFGLFFATIGLSMGLTRDTAREVAAVLLIAFGAVLLSSRTEQWFERGAARLGAAGAGVLARLHPRGWSGQFVLGSCLGLVWTPCVGPTVGAATTLASQRIQLTEVALLMVLFGLGASTPLLVVGSLSRSALQRLRGPLLRVGRTGRRVLGGSVLALGLAVLSGLDKVFEAWLVRLAPGWLNELSTRY